MRRENKQQGGGVLPPGYTQLEYIESTGTQYINTGIIPSSDIEVAMDVQLTSVSQGETKMLFGCNNYYSMSTKYYMLMLKTTSDLPLQVNCGANGLDTLDIPIASASIARTNAQLSVNGTLFTATIFDSTITRTFSGGLPTISIYLFARRVDNAVSNCIMMKLYRCTVSANGVSYDFIPALRLSDNKPGLYDVVNDQFHVNQGTGEFLYT